VLILQNGAIDINKITNRWHDEYKNKNLGALITFVGIVRSEDDIDGLSFDLYKPILNRWFKTWQEKGKKDGATILMAHSIGDVMLHQSSYISAVFSKQRRVALRLIDEFVEDFKANAPIWKYDIKDGKRVYAEARSKALEGSGLLSK
jgi:molybdopterin synthase catalytic subunit